MSISEVFIALGGTLRLLLPASVFASKIKAPEAEASLPTLWETRASVQRFSR